MGERGPKRRPTELLKGQGSWRGKARDKVEPKPTKGIPRRPTWLRPEAAKYWPELAKVLSEMGVLTLADKTGLALLCEPLADYLMARDVVEAAAEKEGVMFISTTEKGNVIQHPAVGVMNKAWERVVKMLREFGLTPASRAGLQVEKPPGDQDPLLALLKARRGLN